MERSPRALVVLLFVLPWLAAGALSALAPPVLPTAKTHLAAVGAAAKKWQPDAVLIHVRTDTAQTDGRAYGWLYVYYSPKAKAKTMFMVDEKGKIGEMPTFMPDGKPLGEFVDSDTAIGAAIKAGMKTHNAGMLLSLKQYDRAEWSMSDRDFSYTVDGATGKLLKKEKN